MQLSAKKFGTVIFRLTETGTKITQGKEELKQNWKRDCDTEWNTNMNADKQEHKRDKDALLLTSLQCKVITPRLHISIIGNHSQSV